MASEASRPRRAQRRSQGDFRPNLQFRPKSPWERAKEDPGDLQKETIMSVSRGFLRKPHPNGSEFEGNLLKTSENPPETPHKSNLNWTFLPENRHLCTFLTPSFGHFRQNSHLGGSEFQGILETRPRKPTTFDIFLKSVENGSISSSGEFWRFPLNSGYSPDLKWTRFEGFLKFSQKLPESV